MIVVTHASAWYGDAQTARKRPKLAFQPLDDWELCFMVDQQIRDKMNRLLATIKTLSSGKQEIRSPMNKLLGTYDPKSNETRDPMNRLVAKGNALTSLIPPS